MVRVHAALANSTEEAALTGPQSIQVAPSCRAHARQAQPDDVQPGERLVMLR
jgi:hypothetical protein